MLIDEKIRSIYEQLPNSERQVADSILEYPGDVVVFTSVELAKRAGSSNSAVTRLIQRLGFKDYREVQREVRDAQIQGVAFYRTTTQMGEVSSEQGIQEHLNQEQSNLAATFGALSAEDLRAAAAAVAKARRVWVIGLRSGYFPAAYMRRQLICMRPDVYLLPIGGQSVMEDLASATAEDVVISIGLRRRAPLLKDCMILLHEMGVPCVYFCDNRSTSPMKYARWNFICYSKGSTFFASNVTVQSLLYFFCVETQKRLGRIGQQRMAMIEKSVNELSEADNTN